MTTSEHITGSSPLLIQEFRGGRRIPDQHGDLKGSRLSWHPPKIYSQHGTGAHQSAGLATWLYAMCTAEHSCIQYYYIQLILYLSFFISPPHSPAERRVRTKCIGEPWKERENEREREGERGRVKKRDWKREGEKRGWGKEREQDRESGRDRDREKMCL